jgi:hypothetical protein
MGNIPFLQAINSQYYKQPAFKGYSEGYHQASAYQGVPNTTPYVMGIPSTEDMLAADKIASSKVGNPFGAGATTAVGRVNPTDVSMITRPQNESRELEYSDVSGSHLGYNLDLQGIENKAWGKGVELI